METQLFVSVIIPVFNAPQHLKKCIAAIKASTYTSYEIIVVDDASTDDSPEIARELGAKVLQLSRQSGPAAARNYGAQKALGDILLFVDSDVLIKRETIGRVVSNFNKYPDIAAVFGSYDDDPAERNFFSQYKNLVHHFVHQQSKIEAVTFWAGCGAVRKQVFLAVGGFDQEKYSRPCIEDIELGYRLKAKGYRILLDKQLQVKHLKEWRLKSLLRADIFYRAIPWTKLILERQEMVNDLNLQPSQKISSGLVALMFVLFPLTLAIPEVTYALIILLVTIFILNYKLYTFFLKRKGIFFAFNAFSMQLLYYFYSGIAFSIYWALTKLKKFEKTVKEQA